MSETRPTANARTLARECAVQALYQWQMTGENLDEIERQFVEDDRLQKAKRSYFSELLHRIPHQLAEIDAALSEFVDRPVEKIDPVERAILRIGAYELLHRLDIPCRVAINESVNLAKCFGAEDSHKYVNGILDKIARQRRGNELTTARPQS